MFCTVLLFWATLAPLQGAPSSPNLESDSKLAEFTRHKETLLRNPDPYYKSIAAGKLVEMDYSEAKPFLRGLLREPTDVATTIAVLKGFSSSGDYSALEEMLLLVNDERETIRNETVKAFKEMPDKEKGWRLSAEILRVINSPSSREGLRRAAMLTAGELGLFQKQAIEGIAEYLDSNSLSQTAKDALHQITGRWFVDRAYFDSWWNSRKGWTREQILQDSIQFANRQEVEAKIQWMKGDLDRHISLLSDVNPELRKAAAIGIANFRSEGQVSKAIDPLCQQLRKESDPVIRETILSTLGLVGVGNPLVRDLLLKQLDSFSSKERRTAVRALNGFAADEAVLPILSSIVGGWVRGTRDDEVDFRIDLLQTLARAGEPKSNTPIELTGALGITLLKDPNPEVRKLAALALGVFGGRESIPDLGNSLDSNTEKDPNVRFNAARAMSQVGTRIKDMGPVLEYLHSFLKDPAYQNRRQAADLLGELRDSRSNAPLLAQLQSENNTDLRQSILGAVGKIGDPNSLDTLLRLSWKDSAEKGAFFQTLETLCGKDPKRLLKTAVECAAHDEPRWSIALLEKMLLIDGLDAGLQKEAEKTLAPSYRRVARELALIPNAPEGAGKEYLAKARNLLIHLKQSDPEQIEWPLSLAEIQVDLGQREEGMRVYQELVPTLEKVAAQNPELLRRGLEPLAVLLLEKKDLNGAVAVLSKLLTSIPQNRPLREKLARLNLELDKPGEAIAHFQKLASEAIEDKAEQWRCRAELCDLLFEYCNGETVLSWLQPMPNPVDVPSALYTRLQVMLQKALEQAAFVGPFQTPRVNLAPPDKKN